MTFARPPRIRVLAPFVDSVWVQRGELAHRFERLLPSGRIQLLINLDQDEIGELRVDQTPASRARGAAVQGPRSGPVVLDTSGQRSICGVSFRLGTTWPFLRVPASALAGRVVDLTELWGRDGALLRERLLEIADPTGQLDLLESALLERARDLDGRDEAVAWACAQLASGERVHVVRDHLGLAPQRLIDLFHRHVGLSPKLFARIARFQNLVDALSGEVGWAEAAVQFGFSDQAHLIREFKEFAGVTPTAYHARSREAVNHCPIEL